MVFAPIFSILKTSTHFAHFGLESGMVFKELWECLNVFIFSIPNELKKEKVKGSFGKGSFRRERNVFPSPSLSNACHAG